MWCLAQIASRVSGQATTALDEDKSTILEQLKLATGKPRVDVFSSLKLGDVLSVSCGGSFMCCVLASGAVRMLGPSELGPSLLIGPEPVPLPPVTNAVAGFAHVIAFAANTDRIYSWGYNRLLCPEGLTGGPPKENTQVGLSCRLSFPLTVFCLQQCGRSSATEVVEPGLLAAFEGKRVVQVACGGAHTLVLTDAGEVFGWVEEHRRTLLFLRPQLTRFGLARSGQLLSDANVVATPKVRRRVLSCLER
jgi:alpha-tubulin suppressor-like RCC1 family protein